MHNFAACLASSNVFVHRVCECEHPTWQMAPCKMYDSSSMSRGEEHGGKWRSVFGVDFDERDVEEAQVGLHRDSIATVASVPLNRM